MGVEVKRKRESAKRGLSGQRRRFGSPKPAQAKGNIEDLWQEVASLRAAVATMSGYERIANVIDHSASEIVAELKPLRNLRPPLTALPLEGPVIDALTDLRKALKAPDWSNAQSLPIDVNNVPFIGAAREELPR